MVQQRKISIRLAALLGTAACLAATGAMAQDMGIGTWRGRGNQPQPQLEQPQQQQPQQQQQQQQQQDHQRPYDRQRDEARQRDDSQRRNFDQQRQQQQQEQAQQRQQQEHQRSYDRQRDEARQRDDSQRRAADEQRQRQDVQRQQQDQQRQQVERQRPDDQRRRDNDNVAGRRDWNNRQDNNRRDDGRNDQWRNSQRANDQRNNDQWRGDNRPDGRSGDRRSWDGNSGDRNAGDRGRIEARPQYRGGDRVRASRDNNWNSWRNRHYVRSYRSWDYDRRSRPWFDYNRRSYISLYAPSYAVAYPYQGYGSSYYGPVACDQDVVGNFSDGFQRQGGAIVGPILGGGLGDNVNLTAQACVAQVLEYVPSNQPIYWEDDYAQYQVTALRTYSTGSGRYCRDYQANVYIGGDEERVYGTACRMPDGTWRAG